MPLGIENLVWNRACFENKSSFRAGDRALAALLAFHGLACNGGVLHAVEVQNEAELTAACAGFQYFGLDIVALIIEEARRAQSDGSDLEEIENDLNERYYHYSDGNDALSRAFKADFAARPENYAPVQ